MPFRKGDPNIAKGGKRENSGPKPSWFKLLCEKELRQDRAKAVLIIGKIARNELRYEKPVTVDGQATTILIGPTPNEIISAAEFLRDSAFGKPSMNIEAGEGASVTVNLVSYA